MHVELPECACRVTRVCMYIELPECACRVTRVCMYIELPEWEDFWVSVGMVAVRQTVNVVSCRQQISVLETAQSSEGGREDERRREGGREKEGGREGGREGGKEGERRGGGGETYCMRPWGTHTPMLLYLSWLMSYCMENAVAASEPPLAWLCRVLTWPYHASSSCHSLTAL